MDEVKNIDSGLKTRMTLREIGDTVRDAREQKEMTQQELADEVGVNITSISLIENGSNRTGKKLLNTVALHLGITFDLSFPYEEK